MALVTTGLLNLIVILLIGILAGLVLNHFGGSWLGRKMADASGLGDVTYALVGVAGSFLGFHIGVLLGLLPSPAMLYLAALLGAALTLWLWRGR